MKYRPEIDGLRTIAVIPVLFYHAQLSIAGYPILPGGYLGVDVFFVISGYLITSILLREMASGSFTYAGFYDRRARRILPILLVVMLCCCLAAWELMLPKAINEYAGSQLSSLFFSSNIWFWLQDSYTAEASELRPLLHTWSLSIEEQFYLLFPALLLIIRRAGNRYLTNILVVFFMLSFALAQYSSSRFIDANFYLAHTRAWELLAGALLAKLYLDGKRPATHLSIHGFLPVIGLLLILLPMIGYHDHWPHPSALTLPPVIGTMLLIWYLPQAGLTQMLLSSRVFTSIGLVSYSLYLWHFPIFAFAKISSVTQLSTPDKIICLAAAGALAATGYFLVEKPARNRNLISSRLFYTLILVAISILIGFSAKVLVSDGAPQRLGSIQSIFDGAWQRDSWLWQNGERCDLKPIDKKELCYFEAPEQNGATTESTRTLINVGDSHADVFGNQLLALARQRGWNYQHITVPGCPYVEGAYRFKSGKESERCDAVKMDRIKRILESSPPSIIVYTGRFPGYLSGEPFDNEEGGKEPHAANRKLRVDPDGAYPSRNIDQLIQLTINNLLVYGHTVVLMYPIPEVGFGVPKLVKTRLSRVPATPVSRKQKAFQSMEISTSYDVFKRRSASTVQAFDAIPENSNLIRIRPDQTFCSETTDRCYTHDDTSLYYYDDNHLSQRGVELLVELISLRFIMDQ